MVVKLFLGSAMSLLAMTSLAHAEKYTIDADHSSVGFKIRHLAISSVPGKFEKFSGTITFDPEKMEESKVEATIKADTIDTDQTKRDDHLRSKEFFNAKEFPTITFKSTEIKVVDKDTLKVSGGLTMHGVTKPVVLDVTYGGSAKDMYGNERVAFSATTTVNRKDFGLTWSKLLETGALVVGDEVKVSLEVEGTAEKKS